MSEPGVNVKQVVTNAVWFKVCWLGCIYFGNAAAMLIAPLTLFIHMKIVPMTAKQWLFVLIIVVVGILFDSLLGAVGLLVFPKNALLPPFWLITIWIAFATLLLISLPRIIIMRELFVVLTGVGGMLSYFAGGTISAVQFGQESAIVLPMLFCGWALMGVLLHQIYLQMFSKTEKSNG